MINIITYLQQDKQNAAKYIVNDCSRNSKKILRGMYAMCGITLNHCALIFFCSSLTITKYSSTKLPCITCIVYLVA